MKELKFIKARRLREKWFSKGIRNERKNSAKEKKETVADFEKDIKILRSEVRDSKNDSQKLTQMMRKDHAIQIKILRKDYHAKVKGLNHLIESNSKKEEYLNEQYFCFNQFLSNTFAKLKTMSNQQEKVLRNNAVASDNLTALQDIQRDFERVLSQKS